MIWTKRAAGILVLAGAALPSSCTGENQLVGSDPLNDDGGAGAGQSGVANVGASSFFITQLAAGNDKCLPLQLPVAADGNASCKIYTTRTGAACSCDAAGLGPVSTSITEAIQRQLADGGFCPAGGVACADYCACEVQPATGEALTQCQTQAAPDSSSNDWCYVSADGGSQQAALVADCPSTQQQRLRFIGSAGLDDSRVSYLACASATQTIAPAALGEPCVSADEYVAGFNGSDRSSVNVDDHASACESHVCIQNHFQGRASCPYGQSQGNAGCLLPGSQVAVTVPVEPQLKERPPTLASTCSCHCAGSGPGPYCTCPDSMQCEHLIDDLGVGQPDLAGSYCIPKGARYDSNADSNAL